MKVLKIRLWSAEYLENVDEIFLINKIILITLNIPSSVWKEEACLLNEENIFPGNLWPSLPSSPNVRTEKAEVGWEESETQTLLTVTSWPRPEAIWPEIGVNWMLSNAFLTTFLKGRCRKYFPDLKNKIEAVQLVLYSWEWFNQKLYNIKFVWIKFHCKVYDVLGHKREIILHCWHYIGYHSSDPSEKPLVFLLVWATQ